MKRDKRILIPRDEFEEEAGEGLGQLSCEEAEADLRELKARMGRRIARPRAIWLSAAAAMVILLVGSALLVTLLRKRPLSDSQLAERVPGKKEAVVADKEHAAPAGEVITDTALIAMAEPIEKRGYESAMPAGNMSYAHARPAIAEIAEHEIETDATDEIFILAGEIIEDLEVADEQVVVLPVTEYQKVVEALQEEIPQARAEAMKTRTVAEVRDQARAEAVKTRTVAGASDKAKTEAGRADTIISLAPSPLGGWERYREWVARNLKYPEGVLPVVRQEVVVSFTVQADSTITDLKAVSSPGQAFTYEVYRLLLDGPQWVPARSEGKRMPELVVLKIVFK
ncbi:MAG TPA: hypothetical protein PKL90_01835 [Bacteroidales bacterium]|nr:hypothetical protein [Bacteroidales bacterium]